MCPCVRVIGFELRDPDGGAPLCVSRATRRRTSACAFFGVREGSEHLPTSEGSRRFEKVRKSSLHETCSAFHARRATHLAFTNFFWGPEWGRPHSFELPQKSRTEQRRRSTMWVCCGGRGRRWVRGRCREKGPRGKVGRREMGSGRGKLGSEYSPNIPRYPRFERPKFRTAEKPAWDKNHQKIE